MANPLILTVLILLPCTEQAMAAMRCGDCGRTPVPYPLSTAPNCGNQLYKVRCTSGNLWLDALNGSSYMISSVNPKTQRMIIQPSGLLPNTCLASDFRSLGIQLDPVLPFNITSSNTILLMNCTDRMYHLQIPINCSSTSVCHTYMQHTASTAVCLHEPLCCDFRTGGSQTAYVIRVHDGGCLAYQSFVDLNPSLEVAKWPKPGLEIEWVMPQEPVCKFPVDCRDLPKSKCLPDPASVGQKRCFCRSGHHWDPILGSCRKCRHGKGCKASKSKLPVMADTGKLVLTDDGDAIQSSIAGALGALLLLILGGALVIGRRYHMKREARKILVKEREDILNANNSGKAAKIFTVKELKRATINFSKENLLGSGGFGEVFKGVLEDGTITAVKRAKPGNTKGITQVLNEVRILCQVNHRSLVRLLGCCVELEQPLLIYEYVPNGTLFEHLHGLRSPKCATLDWRRRLSIAHQTAEGLAYLHFSAVPPIYHRDVKSSNILLDEKLDAKVSDFGLSRLVDTSESECSHICTSAQGTLGYLDPEYYLNLQLTDRSDVYSFGVVLLELLTSKKAIDFNREEENLNLVVYMKRIIEEEKLIDVVDSGLREGASNIELDTMRALGNLAAACLNERRQNRPSMKEVAEEIEYIISIIPGEA
ncbi:hypothetical protein RJ639_032170 [Escallonia herrerae]|uniref:Protein kinase domain-containing protein n=1 Tax=Escallonia herrerae TaxID=1293975 RepID=A0AA88X8W3_9ASTE|nr:hypothetical protein RJ639_032170 [Escallonia herrerae]